MIKQEMEKLFSAYTLSKDVEVVIGDKKYNFSSDKDLKKIIKI